MRRSLNRRLLAFRLHNLTVSERMKSSIIIFCLLLAVGCASAEKVAPDNAHVEYFISSYDCSVAASNFCGDLSMASEYIFNDTNSECTWWCRPVRTEVTSLAIATSSSTTSSQDYTVPLIVIGCILVILFVYELLRRRKIK